MININIKPSCDIEWLKQCCWQTQTESCQLTETYRVQLMAEASYTVLESKNNVLLRSFMMACLIKMMGKVKTISPNTISMLVCVGVGCSSIMAIWCRKRKIPAAQTFLWPRPHWHQPGHFPERKHDKSTPTSLLLLLQKWECVYIYIFTLTPTGSMCHTSIHTESACFPRPCYLDLITITFRSLYPFYDRY